MIFLADESVDSQIVPRLRADGHSVTYIAESPPGIDDRSVLDLANRNGALLITADRDFGELVHRLGWLHSGVLYIRLAGPSPDAKASAVVRAVNYRGSEMFSAFSVISPGHIRIRHEVTAGQVQPRH